MEGGMSVVTTHQGGGWGWGAGSQSIRGPWDGITIHQGLDHHLSVWVCCSNFSLIYIPLLSHARPQAATNMHRVEEILLTGLSHLSLLTPHSQLASSLSQGGIFIDC